uniref:sulfotransferase family cytosolic 1B member 1-like isoform X4 n=1 Tax=Styela clava TaxID=7725 RepID=UPI00193A1910|nr:sulfotransferase family cytosolic 1B member 1-like isoform X4 [Styela clava]
MFFYILLVTIVTVVISAMYIKSMRPADVVSLAMKVSMKSGLMALMIKTGLNKKIRSPTVEVVASNGFKFVAESQGFAHLLEPILKLKIREDDIFVVTYPKAGTTWMQEIVWLICNNADIKAAKSETVTGRSAFLDLFDVDSDSKGLQSLENWPLGKQRIMKTHLPYELLPEGIFKESGKGCKIIYVSRNPKDVCVSYYFFHHLNVTMEEPGTWNNFLAKFCSGKVAWGSWFLHTLKFWKESQKDKRIHFTTFERMKNDLRGEVVSVSKFLSVDLTDEQIGSITNHCSFTNMKNNTATNYTHTAKYGWDFDNYKFMRKGEVGDWKNYFTLNQNIAFDEMYEEKMKNSGLELVFELE